MRNYYIEDGDDGAVHKDGSIGKERGEDYASTLVQKSGFGGDDLVSVEAASESRESDVDVEHHGNDDHSEFLIASASGSEELEQQHAEFDEDYKPDAMETAPQTVTEEEQDEEAAKCANEGMEDGYSNNAGE